MESSKACFQAIYARFNSDGSTEDLDKQFKNEGLVIYATPSNESISEMQIIEHKIIIDNWRDAQELPGLYGDIINYYVYLIWEYKVKTLKSTWRLYLSV